MSADVPTTQGKKTMTQAALAANRANAQKSTGPKTPEGKAKSRRNAAVHFAYAAVIDPLLPNESSEQYYAMRGHYQAMFRPKNVLQHQFLDTLVAELWCHNRLYPHEANAIVYCPDPAILHDELEKISRIQGRKWRKVLSILKALRETIALGEGQRAHEKWPQADDMRVPSDFPKHMLPDSVLAPVGYDEHQAGGIPNSYQTRNPEVTSGKYSRMLDHQLALVNKPNAKLRDLIQARVHGIPLGAIPDVTGLM